MQDINVTTFCINPCFSMSPTVLATPLSGTQLMLMECKLLTWQQTRSSPGSQTFQMGLQLCPYLWPNDCQRVQWQWTWPSSTLSPPTGVTTWGTLSLRWWHRGHQLCLVSWIWLELKRAACAIWTACGVYMCVCVLNLMRCVSYQSTATALLGNQRGNTVVMGTTVMLSEWASNVHSQWRG